MRFLLVSALLLVCALACTQLASAAAADSAAKVPTYYELLDISTVDAGDASLLKRAYRKQAMLFHPDRATAADSADARARMQATFQRLANAYEVLSSRRMRVRYDHLVTQEGKVDYDGQRDWDAFDVARGFKRKPLSKAEKEAEFKFKQAEEMFRKAADDAESFALWTSLAVALAVALMPAAYMAYKRYATAAEAVAARKGRSSELKASQAVLAEMQAEQARQQAAQREEDRAYQRELRAQREAAAAAAATEAAAASDASPDSEWEVVDGVSQRKVASPPDADAEATAVHSDDEEEEEEAAGTKVLLKCQPCKKSFKSQQQLENHENSNQHKKAVRDAEKGAKKKSRRDE